MSSKDVQTFHEMVAADPELKDKFSGENSLDGFLDKAVKIAGEKGLSFTKDEALDYMNKNADAGLNDADLKATSFSSGCGIKGYTYSFPGCSLGGN